jgi:hypothetical protein
MSQHSRDILHLLKLELAFLDCGGYRRSERTLWKPITLILESPVCPNYFGSEPAHSCQECQLIRFVPPDRQQETWPCYHVPLNASGETLHSLYERGTQGEREEALRNWLVATIARIERERFSKSSGTSRHGENRSPLPPLVP